MPATNNYGGAVLNFSFIFKGQINKAAWHIIIKGGPSCLFWLCLKPSVSKETLQRMNASILN